MDITIALKLLYYIIILLPMLMTIKYFVSIVYEVNKGEFVESDNLARFIWGILSIISYGTTVLFINKSMQMSAFPIVDELFYPIILVLFGIAYAALIENKDIYTSGKIQGLLCMPLLTVGMFLIEKLFG